MRGPSTEETRSPDPRSGLSSVGRLLRQHDRDRFQTALFAPAAAREALFALYAFNYEIARVRESVREPMLGQIRLQWWRETIDAAYGEAKPRRHEVVEPLTAAIRSYGLSRGYFDRLIDARERDLDDTPPEDFSTLHAYAEATSSALMLLALEVLRAATPAAIGLAQGAGIAYAVVGLLRAMPAHARAGRCFIPRDLAAETGFDAADYAAGRATPALRRAVEAIAEDAALRIAGLRAAQNMVPRAALPALLPTRIAAHALKRLKQAGYDPFCGAGEGDPLQSWRLAFAALTGRFC